MKIIVTTSNKYHHLLKIFVYLFNKNWSDKQQVEIVGYDAPNFDLPNNFTFYSLGQQIGDAKNFTRDLRKYFEKQDHFFIWLFDDSFIRSVDFNKLEILQRLTSFNDLDSIGRINLSNHCRLQFHTGYDVIAGYRIIAQTQESKYRLSTQPSIWNKDFLLKYMKDDLTPWEFETQDSINDGWKVLGPEDAAVKHNEGVTKHDIFDYNLNGILPEQIEEMKQLGIL